VDRGRGNDASGGFLAQRRKRGFQIRLTRRPITTRGRIRHRQHARAQNCIVTGQPSQFLDAGLRALESVQQLSHYSRQNWQRQQIGAIEKRVRSNGCWHGL